MRNPHKKSAIPKDTNFRIVIYFDAKEGTAKTLLERFAKWLWKHTPNHKDIKILAINVENACPDDYENN